MRSPTRSGAPRDERQVLVGAEPHLRPLDRRIAVVHAQGLEAAVGDRPVPRHRDHRGQHRERLGEGQAELGVGRVHQGVRPGLDLGGPGVEVVGARAARGDHLAADVVVGRAPAVPWTPRAWLGPGPAVLQADDVALVPHDPADRRGRRPRARSASRPASSGRQPQRGSPTLTSISTSGTPARAAAAMVSSESTATVTRAPDRASTPSRVASATSLARRRSSPSPARAMPSISAMVAQVNPVCPRRLARRQRRALVRLDVGSQPGAGQRLRHGVEVGLEPGGVDEEGRGRQLRRPHAGRLPTGGAR